MALTKAQRKFLNFAEDFQGLRDGQAERDLQTGGPYGIAAEKVIQALERKGYVSGELAEITDAGRKALEVSNGR
jgi:hypothetical protein